MSLAYRCGVCDEAPRWRIDRRGDAVVSWACSEHLSAECERLQRDWEATQLVVKKFAGSAASPATAKSELLTATAKVENDNAFRLAEANELLRDVVESEAVLHRTDMAGADLLLATTKHREAVERARQYLARQAGP